MLSAVGRHGSEGENPEQNGQRNKECRALHKKV